MLGRFIVGLRQELWPIVRAETEAKVEENIRAEQQTCIEQELFEELVANEQLHATDSFPLPAQDHSLTDEFLKI